MGQLVEEGREIAQLRPAGRTVAETQLRARRIAVDAQQGGAPGPVAAVVDAGGPERAVPVVTAAHRSETFEPPLPRSRDDPLGGIQQPGDLRSGAIVDSRAS